jgi:hypothetical protein
MNTIRMAAFVAAMLITAFFFRAITYGLVAPQQAEAATATSARSAAD